MPGAKAGIDGGGCSYLLPSPPLLSFDLPLLPSPFSGIPIPLPFHSPVPCPSSTSSPPSLPSFPVPFPPLLLEVGPLKPARGSNYGSAVSSPSGVRGGVPAEIEFGALESC